ncbi:MAG TPA: hypothetical protein VKG82_07520 [Solirubrobacteraceae bacterium]|nr:hypothetical protein [Solirubrobacteraceae bacterium]
MRTGSPATVLLCLLALLSPLALSACGNADETQPISHSTLESMLVNPFPVYWLGGTFHDLSITEVFHDPSGAYSIQYGTCLTGGQGVCAAPLRIVTSGDNGFLPVGTAPGHATEIRGVQAVVAQKGTTIIIATGSVVVDIFAKDSSLAYAAALTAVPINEPGALGAPLPARQADSGYGSTPLPTQEPIPLRPLR